MAEEIKNTTLFGVYFPTRAYGVQDMNDVLEGLVTDGALVPYVTNVVVNFDVRVTLGLAKALGAKARRTTAETIDFTVDAPDPTLDRIDSIFYRVDLSVAKRDSIVYRPGIAAASPNAPDADTSSPTLIKEIRLCNINVGGGVVNLIPANIDETVQEHSSVSLLVDLATKAINSDNDEDGNKIKTFYSKRSDSNIYSYDQLSQLSLQNSDFGSTLIISIGKIIEQLILLNPTGDATYLGAPNSTTHPLLIDDINDNLGLSENEYNLQVETVRSEFSGAPSTGQSNKVTIIAPSTGDIYTGIFDTSLTPDLSMKKLIGKAQHNIETYDQFEQLALADLDFSPSDWEANMVKIIDQMLVVSPNNSSIFAVYFTSSGTNEFSNLLDSLDSELSKTSTGYALKVEILFNESSGVASKVSPTRITVVRNGDNSTYEGYYDSGSWFGFVLSEGVSVSPSLTPGAGLTITEERIEKIGRMVVGSVKVSFPITINQDDDIFTINDDDFKPIIDVPVRGRTVSDGYFDMKIQGSSGSCIYDDSASLPPTDSIRVTFSYISKQ